MMMHDASEARACACARKDAQNAIIHFSPDYYLIFDAQRCAQRMRVRDNIDYFHDAIIFILILRREDKDHFSLFARR